MLGRSYWADQHVRGGIGACSGKAGAYLRLAQPGLNPLQIRPLLLHPAGDSAEHLLRDPIQRLERVEQLVQALRVAQILEHDG